jgi:hypothetical protein
MSTTAPKPATTPIPVQLSDMEFTAFILPHLSMPKRGPKCNLGYHRVFNLILWLLYTGMQWKCLPIPHDANGTPAIHEVYGIYPDQSAGVLRCLKLATSEVVALLTPDFGILPQKSPCTTEPGGLPGRAYLSSDNGDGRTRRCGGSNHARRGDGHGRR